MQYFQNARLEQAVSGVQLGALGDELSLAHPPDYPEDVTGTLFPETGHYLDPAFAAYYTAHGGEAVFGPPISPARAEDGLTLQNFRRARLVLDDGQVRLGNLGSIALSVFPPADPTFVAAPPRALEPTQSAISANLSVAQPTLQSGTSQTVYLYVVTRDDNSPVSNAQALLLLTYDTGVTQLELPPTDAHGISSLAFSAPPASPGTSVIVEAHVVWGDAVTSVSTIYLQWW